MVFSSLSFLFLFLPLLYLLYFIIPNLRWRNGVLVAMSLLFYGWGEPVWILAMLFSTLVNYFCARTVTRIADVRRRRLVLTLGVLASVSFLAYFKYAAFFANSFAALFGSAWRMSEPRLPIGISFYTFQVLTYTVDVYRGKAEALDSPLDLLLYVSCFPQLIAGPIVQYADIAPELRQRAVLPDDFADGFRRFVKGLAKKVLLANLCGQALEELALGQAGWTVVGAWLGAFLYGLQIYFDFSAYSDMAIGLGRTLGFHYKENFDFPFASQTVGEFWRRWHMSLGAFFRDYVYIHLGGSRCSTARAIFNTLFVWLLTGLWHGANWNFVLWGLYFGVILLLERYVLKKALKRAPKLLRLGWTSLLVLISWVIFYEVDLGQMGRHLTALVGLGVTGWIDDTARTVLRTWTLFPLLAWLLSLPTVPAIQKRLPKKLGEAFGMVLTPLLLGVSVVFLIGQSYNPFIYFRF